jgi:hypothetical protein
MKIEPTYSDKKERVAPICSDKKTKKHFLRNKATPFRTGIQSKKT